MPNFGSILHGIGDGIAKAGDRAAHGDILGAGGAVADTGREILKDIGDEVNKGPGGILKDIGDSVPPGVPNPVNLVVDLANVTAWLKDPAAQLVAILSDINQTPPKEAYRAALAFLGFFDALKILDGSDAAKSAQVKATIAFKKARGLSLEPGETTAPMLRVELVKAIGEALGKVPGEIIKGAKDAADIIVKGAEAASAEAQKAAAEAGAWLKGREAELAAVGRNLQAETAQIGAGLVAQAEAAGRRIPGADVALVTMLRGMDYLHLINLAGTYFGPLVAKLDGTVRESFPVLAWRGGTYSWEEARKSPQGLVWYLAAMAETQLEPMRKAFAKSLGLPV